MPRGDRRRPGSDAPGGPAAVGIVVLAAGASTRLGSPKQLVQLHGESLLRRTAGTLNASRASEVIVVLGFNFHLQSERLSFPNDFDGNGRAVLNVI